MEKHLTEHKGGAVTGTGAASAPVKNHADFIWQVADLLRGDYKRSEYGKVVLPLTVLRRLAGFSPRRSGPSSNGMPRSRRGSTRF